MKPIQIKRLRRSRRKLRVRKSVSGSSAQPRVTVFRSLKHISVQAIDDHTGVTVAAASSQEKGFDVSGGNKTGATKVGAAMADRLKAKGVTALAFDRNGYKYHGRVKALADAMREGGLKF